MEEKAKQWYEENPELLAVEKAAMGKIAKDDDKEFGFLKDGRAFWHIGFRSKLSGRKYKLALIYSPEHPNSKLGIQGLWVYPTKPTYKMLLDEMNMSCGTDYECMSYSLRDGEGEWHLNLCETETAYKSGWSDCRRQYSIISAANVFLAAKEWIEFYEKGVANQGVGFERCSKIDQEEQERACIDYFGEPAARYYREPPFSETTYAV